MAGKIAGGMMLVSVLYSLFTGSTAALSAGILAGCGQAVELTVSLLGMMCLWGGLMGTAEASGLLRKLSLLLSPLLRFVFPEAGKDEKKRNALAGAVIANLFGIGNASTPLSVHAMKCLREGHEGDTATDDMITFTALGTVFPCILPTTVIALRTGAGSLAPYAVLPAVWMTSLCLVILAVSLCRILGTGTGK